MSIKDVTDLISQLLTMIFHSSLRKGIFPDIWKVARVTPIFKSESQPFKQRCSTITSVIDSTYKWYDNINDMQLILKIFLDLKKKHLIPLTMQF